MKRDSKIDVSKKIKFEEKVRTYIKRDGRSQASITRMLGYSPGAFNKWLDKRMPFKVLQSFCKLLNLDESQTLELFDLAGYAILPGALPKQENRLIHYLLDEQDNKPSFASDSHSPKSYIPFRRNPLFQPRPGEFEKLEVLLFRQETALEPTRLGLIGIAGMGGVGKTQLAIELVYRYKDLFPSGIFWMPAIGTNLYGWQRQLADLAANTDYLPFDDNPSNPENEIKRARHFCRYLATHRDALLILDNVENPDLVISAIPTFAGGDVACTLLYTSRIRLAPPGVTAYTVEQLPEKEALHLLLDTVRSSLLHEILAENHSTEAEAARFLCKKVGYLPLALVHLRSLLLRDSQLTLVRLVEALEQRGVLELAKTQYGDATPLFATFWLSWEKVSGKGAKELLKLASYFPEATPIPLWLIGLATGLGEKQDIFEPLGEACAQLLELNLIESLSGMQIRLHPLIRAFGRQLVAQDGEYGDYLLFRATERLTIEFENINKIEEYVQKKGYWGCLEDIRLACNYANLLTPNQTRRLYQIERWLDRESYLLNEEQQWLQKLPGLLYQQLYNRSLEEGQPLPPAVAPTQWIRQMERVRVEDSSLLRIFAGHTEQIEGVAFSSNGAQVLTGSFDGTAQLWDTETGKKKMLFESHIGEIWSVAFSSNGKQALTGFFNGTAQLWDTETGKLLFTLKDDTKLITDAAFLLGRKQVLIRFTNGYFQLWEVETNRLLADGKQRPDAVLCVAFSLDDKQVLTGSMDGTVRVWDIKTGKLLCRKKDSIDEIKSVHISSKGELLLTDVPDKSVYLRGRVAKNLMHEMEMFLLFRGLKSMAFSPDGTQVLTGSLDGQIYLWDMASEKRLATFEGHTAIIWSVAFSLDGKQILTGSGDGTARLWDVTSKKLLHTFASDTRDIRCVAFSPDGKRVLTSSFEQVLVWEIASGKQITALESHVGANSAIFSPDGKQIFAGSDDGLGRLWTIIEKEYSKPLDSHLDSIYCMAFSPNGTQMLTGSVDGAVWLWDVSSSNVIMRLDGHSDTVRSAIFSPDGKLALTGSDDSTARLWDLASGKLITILRGHKKGVMSVAFSPNNDLLLTGSSGGTARLWKMNNWKRLFALEGHSNSVDVVAFSPNDHYMLTGSYNGTLRLWEINSGNHLSSLEGHTSFLYSVAFSPDGKYILTGSHDGTARLWETASSQLLMILAEHKCPIYRVSFSPDGRLIIICDYNGRLLLWQITEIGKGELLSVYTTAYRVGAIHWQDATTVILADDGGSRRRPYFYWLKLEGIAESDF